MKNTANQIKNKVKNSKRGKLFFPDDFAALGTPDAIRLALGKMHKSGLLMRVAHGIYYYPKKDMKYGNTPIPPTIDEIAYGIAKRDKIRIVPTGSYALNTLGLSTQVQANAVFITDGAPRRIAVGKGRGILFKHTSEARSLAYKSRLLMLIVSALREIGEGKTTPQQLEIIKSHLANVSQKELNTDIQLMPLWVRKLLSSL
ncbi:MAG: type IV toxin-antitoxin system AbiEi family antitoxin domain-containing protein [Prevotellaceae bacterium]|jgi:hypothetical protein|nr:type IV toxin-antitoxin system AbiEi family antitoxin domain-containing protein [Prevotellaceae bacterium]